MIKYLCSCLLLTLLASFTPVFGDTNLLTNPGFENGTDGWEGRSCNIEAVTTPVHTGTKSIKVSERTQEWQGIKQSILGKAVNGKTYKFSAWVRLDNAESGSIIMSVEQTDDSGTKYKNIAKAVANNTGWVELTGEFKFEAGGSLTTLDVYFEGPAASINFFVDDVVVSGPDASKPEKADPNAAKTEPNDAGKKDAK